MMHLSAPVGSSINDYIAKEDFSLSYTIDTAVPLVHYHRHGALMCKVDIKSAFRLVPVHPNDWPLLGMFWEGKYYLDKYLPFGLHPSPTVFNHLANVLENVL